jgi:hypothetical protein
LLKFPPLPLVLARTTFCAFPNVSKLLLVRLKV